VRRGRGGSFHHLPTAQASVVHVAGTLDIASAHGSGLEVIFRRYDSNGEGTLDIDEFTRAVEDLGFDPSFAHNLFIDLDDDGSGAVCCSELVDTLKKGRTSVSDETKKFLVNLATAHRHPPPRHRASPLRLATSPHHCVSPPRLATGPRRRASPPRHMTA
jgi:Ca2+-binding EF-hand superfamily protein